VNWAEKAMAKNQKKKFFTPEEANATLPLLGAIVQDVSSLAVNMRTQHERLVKLNDAEDRRTTATEMELLQTELEQAEEKMHGYLEELDKLGVLLKDFVSGLIDFPAWMNNHEVYLCWRLGETEVGYWHETDAGFAGRQKLQSSNEPRPQGTASSIL
jgi:hypothetical protein